MTVVNTYPTSDQKQQEERQVQIHNRCVLLLSEIKEGK